MSVSMFEEKPAEHGRIGRTEVAGQTPYRACRPTDAELLAALPREMHGERVIGEALAAKFLGISQSWLREHRVLGTGPAVVMLAPRRYGYQLNDLIAWVRARKRSDKARAFSASITANNPEPGDPDPGGAA